MSNKLQLQIQQNQKLIGALASTFSIIMFFSLIEVMMSNLQNKSDIYIQPIATIANGLLWFIYGYGKKDYYIMVPNILACILGLATAIAAFV